MKPTILLEILVETLDDAVAASRGGADRLELCSAPEVGGLTPSTGVLQAIRSECELPVMAMVRPRSGGCCYTDRDFAVMLRERDILVENGASGVVFGFLDRDGRIDEARLKTFRNGLPEDVQAVFHRAFDLTADFSDALKCLIDHRVDRVLTSGGSPTAAEGTDTIRQIAHEAASKISVLGGGGIRPENVVDIVRTTGLREVHASCRATAQDRSARLRPEVRFGLPGLPPETEHRRTDAGLVACMRAALSELGH